MNFFHGQQAINMDELFNYCVELLQVWAAAIGMTYKEINIWIFVIIEPLVFVLMCLWIWRLIRTKKRLLKKRDALICQLTQEGSQRASS